MRTAIHPFLPNGLTGDPVVWIDLLDEGRSVLFDLGDLRRVSNRRLLKVDRAVVTHTHIDHFFGFDQLLRVILGRERELRITGPRGFLSHVQGKISAYTWNLIENYPIRLIAEEVDGQTLRSVAYSGAGRMQPEPQPDQPFTGTIHTHRAFTLHITELDHGIPVLGVALRETEHLAVNKAKLEALGLTPGPWLAELKNAVRRCLPEDHPIQALRADGTLEQLTVGPLSAQILSRTAGQRVAYFSDLSFSAENQARVIELADSVDLMICECTFLDEDADLAKQRNHLTARQAGQLAQAAGARRLAPVHLSPRYQGREAELIEECASAFSGRVVELPQGPAPTFDLTEPET